MCKILCHTMHVKKAKYVPLEEVWKLFLSGPGRHTHHEGEC